MVTYYDKEEYNDTKIYDEDNQSIGLKNLIKQYDDYKGMVEFPLQLKNMGDDFLIIYFIYAICLGYVYKNKYKLVKIFFDTPTFDRITKDKSAKFVDMLAAFGGSMGLLTGFSIISGVEIVYYLIRYFFGIKTLFKNF